MIDKKVKKLRRNRVFRFIYALVGTAITLCAVLAGSSLFFQVNTIEVEGAARHSSEQILMVADIREKSNLFLISTSRIEKRIGKSFPYVETVEVKRQFPGTIRIIVEETTPLASIQSASSWWIIDSTGKVLEETDSSTALNYIETDGLNLVAPRLGEIGQTSEENEGKWGALCALLAALERLDVAKNVAWINLSEKAQIDLKYLENYTVELPVIALPLAASEEETVYDQKVEILLAIVDSLAETDKGTVGTINIRGENGYFQ